jgi:hypothetical protein
VSCIDKIIKIYCDFAKGRTIHGTVLRSIIICGLEEWTPSKSDESTLAIWEGKILRKILGPVKEIGVWRIRTNQELMDLSREPGVMSEVREGRLR